jgi:lipopolysaccharide export system protein LptA
MWQDADSLLAPVIEVDRNQNILKAWGEDTGAQPVVNANFTTALGPKHQQSVVRVHSQTLVYSDKNRQGDFRGSVMAEDPQGIIHADDAIVYLKPAPAARSGARAPELADAAKTSVQTSGPTSAQGRTSQVDRMVATGHVAFTQPGRRGEGEKLTYTADDGKYVLTGTPAAPPKMWDRDRGTTTGAALIFNSQDDSVEVSGGKSSAVTDTRAPK